MASLFRKKIRVLALASLLFMTQCCCCILPVSWQVQQPSPAIRSVVDRLERLGENNFFQVGLLDR
jgi:hypothetical protein